MKTREQLEALASEVERVTRLLEVYRQRGDISHAVSAQQALRRAGWAFHEGDALSVEMSIIDLKGLRE